MARPEIPRLLTCKGCKHEWRGREVVLCPECKSPEVQSRCGAKTAKGLCRRYSAFGQPRCATHGAKNAAKAAVRAGRASNWGNRTFANAVTRAASSPELRDLTHDHATVQEMLGEAVDRASSGVGGVKAWRQMERIVARMVRAIEEDPDALAAELGRLQALVCSEARRSSALEDVDMLTRLRAELLKTESDIQTKAKAYIPILDVNVMLAVLVGMIRELAPEQAEAIGRRIALQFPGTNTQLSLTE